MKHANKILRQAFVALADARIKTLLSLTVFVAMLGIIGCGTPAAPAPPTLDLPQPVENLTASRSGDVLTFTWTQPRRNTDHLLLKGDVDVVICHKLPAGECEPINELYVAPSKDQRVEVAMPRPLATGEPRVEIFALQSRNHLKRAAGLSNEALVIAGSAPAPIEGLKVEEQRQGVVLHWKTVGNESRPVRLIRRRTSPALSETKSTANKPHGDLLTPASEPELLTLLVDPASNGHAVDRTARTKESYEYRAERVIRLDVNDQTLELKSSLSDPVAIDVLDGYAPATPRGLAAVASTSQAATAENQNGIDLSWQPVIDEGLASPVAGYIVYRREGDPASTNPAAWQRISGPSLVIAPAFHDSNVKPGTTYSYSVSAVGANTIISPRSEVATETVE